MSQKYSYLSLALLSMFKYYRTILLILWFIYVHNQKALFLT